METETVEQQYKKEAQEIVTSLLSDNFFTKHFDCDENWQDAYISGYVVGRRKAQQSKEVAPVDVWISVDTPPKDDNQVLICRQDCFEDWQSIGNYVSGDFYNSWDWECPCYPTHWQPLPEPPININK